MMEDFVACENIKRFHNQLLMAKDEPERKLLLELINSEEEKLKAFIARERSRRGT
jgi:hypothetical protein